jgi:hypothetical protein
MFRAVTIIRSSYLRLAKVTVVKISVKIHGYKLCSGVAAYCIHTNIDLTQHAATTLHSL